MITPVKRNDPWAEEAIMYSWRFRSLSFHARDHTRCLMNDSTHVALDRSKYNPKT
jgi:hypothetical protein